MPRRKQQQQWQQQWQRELGVFFPYRRCPWRRRRQMPQRKQQQWERERQQQRERGRERKRQPHVRNIGVHTRDARVRKFVCPGFRFPPRERRRRMPPRRQKQRRPSETWGICLALRDLLPFNWPRRLLSARPLIKSWIGRHNHRLHLVWSPTGPPGHCVSDRRCPCRRRPTMPRAKQQQ